MGKLERRNDKPVSVTLPAPDKFLLTNQQGSVV